MIVKNQAMVNVSWVYIIMHPLFSLTAISALLRHWLGEVYGGVSYMHLREALTLLDSTIRHARPQDVKRAEGEASRFLSDMD